MTRSPLQLSVALFLGVSPLLGADKEEPKHLADARALVKHITWADTKYEHGVGEVVWTKPVKAHCDCSGLVNHQLEHSYGYTEDDLKKWFGAKRPTARRYHDAFADEKAKAWAKVAKLKDAKPGDVIAVKYTEAEQGENTGHVMLIDAAPQEVKLTDAPAGAKGATAEWHVRVIDSSTSAHGSHDTRYEKGEKHTGVGRGTFRVYTDAGGEVVGYTWSTESAKTVYPQKTHHLVIGRLVRE